VGEPRLRLSYDATAVPTDPVGAGRYTLELASALDRRTDIDLVVFARRNDPLRWHGATPGAKLSASAPGPRPLRLAWEQVRLPALVSARNVDVHHGPHYTMPERSRVPAVVTIHDLSFFEAPAWHQRSKAVLFRRAISVAARRAAAVVCPSRVTAEELGRWCQVRAEVFVAHHGVDTERFRPDEAEAGADAHLVAGVDDRLVDGRPYLVFVGTMEPRKDVPSLVAAFSRAARDHPDALLVLAGGVGWGVPDLERAVAASGVAPRILRTGYVPDDAVPALLRSATAAVYPALYEGFGLPALEALACGTPLITTSGTAMEEVAGAAAVLVEPGDVADLAEAIEAALESAVPTDRSRQQRERGLLIAAEHTWDASAGRHMEAYRYAAGRGTLDGDAGHGDQTVG
jgi:glycosyltransferase involved in cell wall biosynthesis